MNHPYRTPTSSLYIGALGGGYLGGNKPLWKAFWLVYILGFLIFYTAQIVGVNSNWFTYIIINIRDITGFNTRTATYITVVLPIFVYSIFCWISVWKCSKNTERKYWAYLAKAVIILHALWLATKTLSFVPWLNS
uniref:ORF135 n=1 Tax=Stutzerimonas stutzeri TaxID=316 RepID=Q8GED3_STUST|nr:ORF135 [Stutzerimonas stutzeri]